VRAVRLILHTHWDREWYLSFEDFVAKLVPTIDEVLDTLHADARLTHFHLDGQIALIDDYLARRPEREPELRAHVAAGRLSCGPWITLVDEFLVSGESIVRSLTDGLRAGDELGGALRVGYVPDQFGHIGQLPQILSHAGLETAVTWRGVPETVNHGDFVWRSPDGSEVLVTYLPFGYGQGARMEHTNEAFIARLEREVARSEPLSRRDRPLMLMTGDDHERLYLHLTDLVDHARAQGIDVAISSLAEEVSRSPSAETPVVTGELRSAARANLLPNTYSVRPRQKVERAGAEMVLERYAEPLAALVLGFVWPHQSLAEAWHLLHLNGAHDSVCGCSIDAVAHAVDERTGKARAIANEVAHEALNALLAKVDAEGELVFNPSPFEREKTSPLGWKVDTEAPVQAAAVTPSLRDGWLTFRDGGLEASLRLVDQADHGDLYTFEPAGPLRYATDIAIDGFSATCTFQRFHATIRTTQHPTEEFFRVSFEIDNRAPDHRVQVEFAASSTPSVVRAGAPFEIVERPILGEGGPSEPPVRQWPARGFVVASNTCVLGDGVFEYEVVPDGIAVTLMRCVGTISREMLAARKWTAGPDIPTPDAQLMGRSARTLGVTSTSPQDPLRLSEIFSLPLFRMPVGRGGELPAEGRLIDLDVPALSALYRNDDELVARVWNPWNEPRSARIGEQVLTLGPHRIETISIAGGSIRG
jgi:Glycosyl hydrolases family 38 N-terminal domain/Alpha mannosidase middle domain